MRFQAWRVATEHANRPAKFIRICMFDMTLPPTFIQRGRATFPIIGIFSEPIEKDLIPKALSTRLYVDIQAPDVIEQIVSGVRREKITPQLTDALLAHRWHSYPDREMGLEFWPRMGTLANPFACYEGLEYQEQFRFRLPPCIGSRGTPAKESRNFSGLNRRTVSTFHCFFTAGVVGAGQSASVMIPTDHTRGPSIVVGGSDSNGQVHELRLSVPWVT